MILFKNLVVLKKAKPFEYFIGKGVYISMKDAEVFETLFRGYDKRVYYTALRYLGKAEDAADITQEVFLRAWRHINSLDPNRAVFPWLFRITRNLCINKCKKRSSTEIGLEFPEHTMGKDAVEENVLAKEAQKEVKDAILNLPDKYREIIILKHYDECSYEEMAEILDIPKGTVMSRLYNARKMLKERLSD